MPKPLGAVMHSIADWPGGDDTEGAMRRRLGEVVDREGPARRLRRRQGARRGAPFERLELRCDLRSGLLVGIEDRWRRRRDRHRDVDSRVELDLAVAVGAVQPRNLAERQRSSGHDPGPDWLVRRAGGRCLSLEVEVRDRRLGLGNSPRRRLLGAAQLEGLGGSLGGPGIHAAASAASSRRSSPQNTCSPTTTEGTPKTPTSAAVSVASRKRSLIASRLTATLSERG